MKHENDVPRTCALCAHAVFSYSNATKDVPPLALFLGEDATDDSSVSIRCPYKKEASAFFFCHRFRFDPLKYRPKKAPKLQELDEAALLLD